MPFYRLLTVCCFALLLCGSAEAQYLPFRKFTIKDGLAQNLCRTVLCDSKGYVWVGTAETGLSRLDGKKAMNFNTSNGLPGNFIYDLHEDKRGQIWVATNKGVALFQQNKFVTIAPTEELVSGITEQENGYLWFALESGNIGFIDADNHFSMVEIEGTDPYLKQSFAADATGKLWMGTYQGGVYMFDGALVRKMPMSHQPDRIYCIQLLPDNQLVFGTDDGVYYYDGHQVTRFSKFAALVNKSVYSIFLDSHKRFWFGTPDGAYCYENGQFRLVSAPNGLDGFVYEIAEDQDNGIWLTSSYGLYRLNNEIFQTYTTAHSLPDNYVWSIAFTSDEKLWARTGKGLTTLENGIFAAPKNLPKPLQSLRSPIISNAAGQLVTAIDNVLYKYDGKSFKTFEKQRNIGLIEYYICAYMRKNGDVLFGGYEGINVFNGSKFDTLITSQLIEGATVNCLTEDKKGNLWIGTEGMGTYILTTDRKIVHVTPTAGLSASIVNTLITDSYGNIWAGTSGKGMFFYPQAEWQQASDFQTNAGLVSNNIYSLVEDNYGNIWAGTDRGISKITPKEGKVQIMNFDDQSGFIPLEVCHHAIKKDSKGNIWVGTVEGLVKVNPQKSLLAMRALTPYITNVSLYYGQSDIAAFANGPDENGLPAELSLPHNQNHLTFECISPGMNFANQIKYQYRLDGAEDEWSPPTEINQITYNNLSPGRYTLQVRAVLGETVGKAVTYTFEVRKAFYQTVWFWGIVAILALAAGYAFFRQRIDRFKRMQNILQHRVKERTREIEEQKVKIQEQSEQLEDLLNDLAEKNHALYVAHEDMTGSVTYAGKIQNAILSATTQSFNQYFDHHFILQIPKGLVAGDHFFTIHQNHYQYLVMLDCISSGVPAAFMSIIGQERTLNLVKDNPQIDPATLLYRLNEQMSQLLQHKTEGQQTINDGIDMAICRIDTQTRELVFAGARRSLHYIDQGQIHVLESSFSSLGIDFVGVETKFENYTVAIKPDMQFYLFSDGFPAQFGGAENRKYKLSNFRKFLEKIYHLEAEEQRQSLLTEFKRWKGEQKQMDDILVVGFRYKG